MKAYSEGCQHSENFMGCTVYQPLKKYRSTWLYLNYIYALLIKLIDLGNQAEILHLECDNMRINIFSLAVYYIARGESILGTSIGNFGLLFVQ